ncbi:transposase [Dactylosporangium fulvum]|uniref:Transposase n=1 Tax=Dactylosporangium fulvum TaxID=53359 RepID=A0ABY5VTQ7_9ACTN|nr:transposase [Dactylosporangium fulvum]UWP81142.1 transposase [Dactylosporangium fulvum]
MNSSATRDSDRYHRHGAPEHATGVPAAAKAGSPTASTGHPAFATKSRAHPPPTEVLGLDVTSDATGHLDEAREELLAFTAFPRAIRRGAHQR